ncbi:hypothetical protein O1611_g3206 [Lasiodiplodia mahajangana]|uniref:Uncharacterized protein n=1 Tax=Lasiodiplodia mahajangana TaxID=1108764 RepID=A0ACC2JSP5_9PEZI|nr:hypothetical protein O1611_g3206 [Lasiodiplodia mahajangana]
MGIDSNEHSSSIVLVLVSVLVSVAFRMSRPSFRNFASPFLGAMIAWNVSAGTSPWEMIIPYGLTILAFAMSPFMSPLITPITRGFAILAAVISLRSDSSKRDEANPSHQIPAVSTPELKNPESINILADPVNAEVDIVAVHGLGSSVETTWTHPTSQKLWLKDFLPEHIRSARIMTFRHNSGWRFKALVKDLPDYGKQFLSALRAIRATKQERPLILIGHSFGGLLIEQALVLAKRTISDEMIAPQNKHLTKSLAGIIFLGTPHAGSGYSTLGKLYCLFHYWDGASTTLLRYMGVDSAETQTLEDEFRAGFDRVPSIDYHECVPNTLLGFDLNLLTNEIFAIQIVTKRGATRAGRTSEALDTDHFGLNKFASMHDDSYIKIRDKIREMKDDKINKNKEHVSKDGPNRKDVFGWLLDASPKPTDPRGLYTRFLDGLHFPISQRSLESDGFKNWLAGNKKRLWCHGMPGAGKTSLATIVIKQLLDMRSTKNMNIGVAYLYCIHKDKAQSAENFLKAILNQVSQQFKELPAELVSLYTEHHKLMPPTSPKLEECTEVLKSEIQHFQAVYLVVDGLDECRADDGNEYPLNINTRSMLLDTIHSLGDRIHLLVTSRERPPVLRGRDLTADFEMMEVRATDDDIKLYVEERIGVNCSLSGFSFDPGVMDRIKDVVAQKAAGMFLPARLYVDHIVTIAHPVSKETQARVMKELRCLPDFQQSKPLRESYRQAYEMILKGLWNGQSKEDIELARATFSWASFSRDPLNLTIDMIKRAWGLENEHGAEAFNSESSSEYFGEDIDYNKTLEDRMLAACRGLITVDQKSKTVRFVHYTAEGYFSDPTVRKGHLEDAQKEIARSCIQCIMSQRNDRGGDGQEQLYRYASLHWGHHARTEETALKDQLDEALSYVPNRERICRSFQAVVDSIPPHWVDPSSKRDVDDTLELIHIAAYFGLGSVATDLLVSGANIESKDCRGWTPMRWAIMGRSDKLVKLLFKRKADLFSKDTMEDPTLFWAIGNRVMGRDIGFLSWPQNTGASYYGDALTVRSGQSFATALKSPTVARTSETIVLFLLENLAKETLEVKNAAGRTLLSIVAANWQWKAVGILHNRHADINARDNLGMTPLLWALNGPMYSQTISEVSVSGTSCVTIGDVIQVEPDTELNTEDSNYAQNMVEPHICKLIGANLESKDGAGRTALSLAAKWGFHDIVRALLKKGANPKTIDSDGMTPLHWACSLPSSKTFVIHKLSCGDRARVRLGTARLVQIRMAASEQFTGRPIETTVERLLRYKADPSAVNNARETPLDLAVSEGLRSHARMLKEYEAMRGRGLSRHSKDGFWAPTPTQIQDYERILLAIIGREARIVIHKLRTSGNASVLIHSTSSIQRLVTEDVSRIVIANNFRIGELRASGKSIVIGVSPEKSMKLYFSMLLATSRPNCEKLAGIVFVTSKGQLGRARIQSLSAMAGTCLILGVNAHIQEMVLSNNSWVLAKGQCAITQLTVRQNARLTMEGESEVVVMEVTDGGKVNTKGLCTVTKVDTNNNSCLQLEAEAKIQRMRMTKASRVWTAGPTNVSTLEVTDDARLYVRGECTIEHMEASHRSQVEIQNIYRIGELRVADNSFLVLQAKGKIDDIQVKGMSWVLTLGRSEVLNIRASDSSRFVIFGRYQERSMKGLVEHCAQVIYHDEEPVEVKRRYFHRLKIQDSGAVARLQFEVSKPLSQMIEELRLYVSGRVANAPWWQINELVVEDVGDRDEDIMSAKEMGDRGEDMEGEGSREGDTKDREETSNEEEHRAEEGEGNWEGMRTDVMQMKEFWSRKTTVVGD